MWKLSQIFVAIEVSLDCNTERKCSLDGGEEAVCITGWLLVPWLLIGSVNSFRENLKAAEIEFYHNLIKLYDWHLLFVWLQDNFIAAEVQNFTHVSYSKLSFKLEFYWLHKKTWIGEVCLILHSTGKSGSSTS